MNPILVVIQGEFLYRTVPFYADNLELRRSLYDNAFIEFESQPTLTIPDDSERFKGIYPVKKIWKGNGQDWTNTPEKLKDYIPYGFTFCTVNPDDPTNRNLWDYDMCSEGMNDIIFESVVVSYGNQTFSCLCGEAPYQPYTN